MDEVEENARKNTLHDVNDVITSKWGNSVIQPFGSYPVGLSIFLSDIDVSILGMGVDDEKTTQKDSQQRRFTNEFQRGVSSSSSSSSQQCYQIQNQHKIIDLTHGNDNSYTDRKKLAGGRIVQILQSSKEIDKITDVNISSKEHPIHINTTSDEGEEEEEEVEVSWTLDTATQKEIIVPSVVLSPALQSSSESAMINDTAVEISGSGPSPDMSSDELIIPPINLSNDDSVSLIVAGCDSGCSVIVNACPVPLTATALDTGVEGNYQMKSESEIVSRTQDAFIDTINTNNDCVDERQQELVRDEMKSDCNTSISSSSDIILISADPTYDAASVDEIQHLPLIESVEEHSSTSEKNVILGNMGYGETICPVVDNSESESAIISLIIEGVPLSQAINSGKSMNGVSKKRRREEKEPDMDSFVNDRPSNDDSDGKDITDCKIDNDLVDDCDSYDYSSDDLEYIEDDDEDDDDDNDNGDGDGDDDEEGLTEDEDELFDEECRGSRARINKISLQRAHKRKAAVRMDLERTQGLDSNEDPPRAANISEKNHRNGKRITLIYILIHRK